MRLLIATTMLFTACSTAYGAEVLNLELMCDGTAVPEFATQSDRERYATRQQFVTTAVSDRISERLSIKDNYVGEVPLVAEDSWIKISPSFIEKIEKKGVSISGKIDRLTGQFEVSFVAEKGSEFLGVLASYEAIQGVVGMTASGYCEKLDPKKKLF